MTDKLAVYRQAVLKLGDRPELVLPVETPLTDAQIKTLQALGVGPRIAIVTPFNPMDERLSAAENERRLEELAADLVGAGIRAVQADGGPADGTYMESGLAFSASLDMAIAIGRRWGQRAIFWYDGRAFRVVST